MESQTELTIAQQLQKVREEVKDLRSDIKKSTKKA